MMDCYLAGRFDTPPLSSRYATLRPSITAHARRAQRYADLRAAASRDIRSMPLP